MTQLVMKTETTDSNLDIIDFANFSGLPDTCAQQCDMGVARISLVTHER